MSTIDEHSPREQMIAILQQQPEDSSFDELLRELACRRATLRGLKDVEEKRTVSNEETLRRIKSWQN